MNSLFVAFHVVFFVGLAFFLNGFLLTRRVILQHSNGTIPSTKSNDFQQIVFVVIDALRFDFIQPNNSTENENYLNQMPFVRHLIEEKSSQTVLMRLIADPPTTTLQRLKALTTGTLPTFIDLSYNFIGYQIEEDNILTQVMNNEHRRKISLLGDDTWLALYPHIPFEHLHVYPSFDVQDLDTVDNGILEHLSTVMNKSNESSLIIAHFLDSFDIGNEQIYISGVDHCGHRYGPKHVEMKRKLNQMDELIRNLTLIFESKNSSSLLMVIGDHGMTQQGDHGGDELNEIETAMFLYTNAKSYFSPSRTSNIRTVSQIDLVPTLSWFLHTLIPFSNLGMIITDVLPLHQRFAAMKMNFQQIEFYFDEISSTLPLTDRLNEIRATLRTIFISIDRERNLNDVEKIFNEFKNEFQSHFRRQWSTFNLKRIFIGLFIMLISCFSMICRRFSSIINIEFVVFSSIFFAISFSNSFIINEGQCLYFLLQTMILTRRIDVRRKFPLSFLLFVSRAFLICREEQQPFCLDPQWLLTKTSNSFDDFLRWISSIIWSLIFVFHCRKFDLFPYFSLFSIIAHWFNWPYALLLFYLSIFCQIISICFVPQRLTMFVYSILLFVVGYRFSLVIFLEYSIYSIVFQSSPLFFAILADYFFYATGHQPVISQIRWIAAFPTGNSSMMNSLIFRGICVVFETFSSQIFVIISLRQNSTIEKLLLIDSMKIFITSFSVFLFRRHLMLWKIFSPRFLFQLVSFVVKYFVVISTIKIRQSF